MKHIAYIGVGSNLGDPLKNITAALDLLEKHPKIQVICLSHFYETEPLTLKGEKQNWYLNCALKLKTSLDVIKLFQALQEIENQLGRKRPHRWAPRTIDLDLLFFDDEILRTKNLTVPHPELHQRRFVLKPLLELAPQLKHPILGISVKTMLKKLDDNKQVIALYKLKLNQASTGILKTPLRERL